MFLANPVKNYFNFYVEDETVKASIKKKAVENTRNEYYCFCSLRIT
jgi:hypothetical protein